MIALDQLEPVGGTESGRYYRLADRVLLALPKPGFSQSEQAAERSLAEFDRLAHADGHQHAIIVLVDRVVSQDAGSRRVWSRPRERETRCAQALVCGNPLARAIGSFFLGLGRGPVRTRMFATLELALVWAMEAVEQHGAPLR